MDKTGSRVSESGREFRESTQNSKAWFGATSSSFAAWGVVAVLAMTAIAASAHHSSTAYRSPSKAHLEWKVP